MLQFGVIAALLFSLLIAVFAIANNQPIIINYLYGKAEVSAIVVILGSAIAGALVIGILNMVRNIKQSLQIRGLKQEIKALEEQLKKTVTIHAGLEEQQKYAKAAEVSEENKHTTGEETGMNVNEPQETKGLSGSEAEKIEKNKEQQ